MDDFNRLHERFEVGEADSLAQATRQMHLTTRPVASGGLELSDAMGPVLLRRVPPRDKQIR
jgi:hypothetical protein